MPEGRRSDYYGGQGQTSPDWMAQHAGLAPFMGGDPNSMIAALMRALGATSPMFGGAQTPSAMAAATAMPPVLGSMFAGPTTPIAGGALSQLQSRAVMGGNLQQAFPSLMGAGGMGPGGMGLGMGAQAGMVEQMQGMTGPGVSMADLSMITGMGTQGGFFRGITDVRQARQQLQSLSRQVLDMSRELSATVQEVSQAMNQAAGMGFTGLAGARAAAQRSLATAQLTGVPPESMQAFQGIGANLGRVFGIDMARGAEMARTAFGTIGWAERTGAISQEALMNATGFGGAAGVSALTQTFMARGLQALDRSQTQYMMAAAIDPASIASGNLQLDPNRMANMLTGANDTQAITRMQQLGRENLALIQQNRDAYATWQRNQQQMMGQFVEGTGGMAPLAFAASAVSRQGIGQDDPNYAFHVAWVYARQQGISTRGEGFRQIQQEVGLALEGGFIGVGAAVAREQAAVFGAREDEQRQRNAAVAARQEAATVNAVIARTYGDYERKVTAPIVQQTERITGMIALQLGVAGGPADIQAGTMASESARAFFSLAGRVAPTFRDASADLSAGNMTLAMLNKDIEQATDPGVKENLTNQRDRLKASLASLSATSYQNRPEYWGKRAESRWQTGAEIAERRGVTGQVEDIRNRATASSGGWDAVMQGWEGIKDNAEAKGNVAGLLSMSVAELDEQLKTGTFMDVLANVADPARAAEAYARILLQASGAGEVSGEQAKKLRAGALGDVGAYRDISRMGKGLAYGEIGRIAGLGDTQAVSRADEGYRAALRVSQERFGTQAVADAMGVEQLGAPIGEWFASMTQESFGKEMTFQQILDKSKIPAERQKELLDSMPPGSAAKALSYQDLDTMLSGVAGDQTEQFRKTMLASGMLGVDAARAYAEVTGEGAVGKFATEMLAAREMLTEEGASGAAVGGAVSRASAAMVTVLKGSSRDMRRVTDMLRKSGDLGAAAAVRVEVAWGQARGGWSAEEVSGFGKTYGLDISKIEGISKEEAALLTAGGTGAKELLRNNAPLLEKLSSAVGSSLTTSALVRGRQAEETPREQSKTDMTGAVTAGVVAAMGSGNVMNVHVVGWPGGPVVLPKGVTPPQVPPVGSTGEASTE